MVGERTKAKEIATANRIYCRVLAFGHQHRCRQTMDVARHFFLWGFRGLEEKHCGDIGVTSFNGIRI